MVLPKLNSALLKRYEESDRLMQAHKLYRKEWFENALARCPAEMMKILRYVRAMPCADEDDFLNRIVKLTWLMNAEDDVKFMLLRVIAKRMDEINGGFDDPLPPDTNMFFKARELLGVR